MVLIIFLQYTYFNRNNNTNLRIIIFYKSFLQIYSGVSLTVNNSIYIQYFLVNSIIYLSNF